MHVTFSGLALSTDAKRDETLLDAARRAGAPIGNSCGGTGVCGRCRVRILEGANNLSAPTSIELRVMALRGLSSDERLACQAIVGGDCLVTTSYW